MRSSLGFPMLVIALATLAISPVPARADTSSFVAAANEHLHRSIAQQCAQAGAITMGVAQAADYVTSVENYSKGMDETDPWNGPATKLVHNKPLGLALGMLAFDAISFALTRHSAVLRCAFEVRQTAVSTQNSSTNMRWTRQVDSGKFSWLAP